MRRARKYVTHLTTRICPVQAWIVGSAARGDFHEGSDIDVVIVADALPAHPLERLRLLYSVAPPNVEPKGYTPAEWEAEGRRRNPMVIEAFRVGIPLVPVTADAASYSSGSSPTAAALKERNPTGGPEPRRGG
ncbi:MAG TPA: nucleotidyltransferase domain-containing protein [Bacillota bacterium]